VLWLYDCCLGCNVGSEVEEEVKFLAKGGPLDADGNADDALCLLLIISPYFLIG